MNIVEYLNEYQNKWEPINMQIINGEKTLHQTGSYMPTTKDFENETMKTLKNRQQSATSFDHIAIDTKQINHIDVDTYEYEFFVEDIKERLPYFLSARKKLPHAFVTFRDHIESLRTKSNLTDDIEVLSGMWSFCRLDAVVYNADKAIDPISNSFLKPKKDKFIENMANKHDAVSFDKLKFVVDNLEWKQFDDYECWFSIINAIVHTGAKNDYERKAELLCHEFSEQSTKYKARQLDKMISALNINASYTFGTLCYYLKECNPDKFKLLYPKPTSNFLNPKP